MEGLECYGGDDPRNTTWISRLYGRHFPYSAHMHIISHPGTRTPTTTTHIRDTRTHTDAHTTRTHIDTHPHTHAEPAHFWRHAIVNPHLLRIKNKHDTSVCALVLHTRTRISTRTKQPHTMNPEIENSSGRGGRINVCQRSSFYTCSLSLVVHRAVQTCAKIDLV